MIKKNEVTTHYIKDLDALRSYLQRCQTTVVTASKSSVVLPFDKIESEIDFVSLTQLPCSMSLDGDSVKVSGPVTWLELREFLQTKDKQLMTYPTETSAQVLASVATAATGEHAFGHGTLRDQVRSLYCMNAAGEDLFFNADIPLCRSDLFKSDRAQKLLSTYQQSFASYTNFKNGPFPRLDNDTDLMIGFEGQLGVILEAVIKVIPIQKTTTLFIKLPRWEETIGAHLEIYHSIQNFRKYIFSCELLDANALSFLPAELQISKDSDLIVLEIRSDDLELVYDKFLSKLKHVSLEDIFEISRAKFHQVRHTIPQKIGETVKVKKGTDTQLLGDDFEKLLRLYQSWSKLGIKYMLFGHFGDGHPHFNFLPKADEQERVEQELLKLYAKVLQWQGSPFAEHGIGMVKRPYIKPFYTQVQYDMFEYLKDHFDPQRKLFPLGFMGIKNS